MTANERLDAIQARVNAATINYQVDSTGCCVLSDGIGEDAGHTFFLVERTGTPGDVAFIAAAREDVPALVNALRAVLAAAQDAEDEAVNTYGLPAEESALMVRDVRAAIEEALS